jgi:hypothetical protein
MMKLKSLNEQMHESIISDIIWKCLNLASTKCKEKALLTYQRTTQPCWTPEERGRLGVELLQTKLIYCVSLHPQNCRLHIPHLLLCQCHDRQTTNVHCWWYVTYNLMCVQVSVQLYVRAHRLIRESSVLCFLPLCLANSRYLPRRNSPFSPPPTSIYSSRSMA